MTSRYAAWVRVTYLPPDGTVDVYLPEQPILDLSADRLKSLGAPAPTFGRTWTARIGFYRGDEDQVLTGLPLGTTTPGEPPLGTPALVDLLIWDPISMDPVLTVALTVDAATLGVEPPTAVLVIPSTLLPGRYACALRITWPPTAPAMVGDSWIHCLGRLDLEATA